MSTTPDVEILGEEAETIEQAAESAAKKVSKDVKDKTFKLTIYARLSGEHNPIHGYTVGLGGGG
jgi:hypothetical protein